MICNNMIHHPRKLGEKTRWKYSRKTIIFYKVCLPAWKTMQWNLDYPGQADQSDLSKSRADHQIQAEFVNYEAYNICYNTRILKKCMYKIQN